MSLFSFRQVPQQPLLLAAKRASLIIPLLISLSVFSIVIACLTGSVSLSLSELWHA